MGASAESAFVRASDCSANASACSLGSRVVATPPEASTLKSRALVRHLPQSVHTKSHRLTRPGESANFTESSESKRPSEWQHGQSPPTAVLSDRDTPAATCDRTQPNRHIRHGPAGYRTMAHRAGRDAPAGSKHRRRLGRYRVRFRIHSRSSCEPTANRYSPTR
jgi:hypothetical protein